MRNGQELKDSEVVQLVSQLTKELKAIIKKSDPQDDINNLFTSYQQKGLEEFECKQALRFAENQIAIVRHPINLPIEKNPGSQPDSPTLNSSRSSLESSLDSNRSEQSNQSSSFNKPRSLPHINLETATQVAAQIVEEYKKGIKFFEKDPKNILLIAALHDLSNKKNTAILPAKLVLEAEREPVTNDRLKKILEKHDLLSSDGKFNIAKFTSDHGLKETKHDESHCMKELM